MKKIDFFALVAMLSVHAIGFSAVYQFAYGDDFSKTAIINADLSTIKMAQFSTLVFVAIPQADRPPTGQVLQLLADDQTTVLTADNFKDKIRSSENAGSVSSDSGSVPVGTSFYVQYIAAPATPQATDSVVAQ